MLPACLFVFMAFLFVIQLVCKGFRACRSTSTTGRAKNVLDTTSCRDAYHVPSNYTPDSMPPSDRRWLLVARSADFADVGPTLGQRLTANHNSGYISLHFADVGPTVDFYSRWWRAIIGDFVKLSKKLFIMVCLKIIFQ